MVIQVAACASGDMNTFIQLVQMHSNTKLLKYVQSHSYFIDKFVLSPNRMIAEKELQYEWNQVQSTRSFCDTFVATEGNNAGKILWM